MIRPVAWIVAALAAGYALHALAQARFDARATATPIGTASSNGVSFAWFFDSTDRTVYVCRTGGTSDAVDCKARAQLP